MEYGKRKTEQEHYMSEKNEKRRNNIVKLQKRVYGSFITLQ